ncbi:MAG TPA: hypothetical protein VGD58_11680 [Herpetosiphonaceae bacterium]
MIEKVNSIFNGYGHSPGTGWINTGRCALGAIVVDQRIVWYRIEHG